MDDLNRLALRVAKGDRSAFEALVVATSDRLVRLSSRIIGDQYLAEDVVQESFVKAYQAMTNGKFDGRASVKTWLYRIVTNGSIDARRSMAHRQVHTHADAATNELAAGTAPFASAASTAAAVEASVALAELTRFMEGLSEDQRVALVLSAVEGFSNKEIADTLGCSEGAVEQRLVRGRAALRKRQEDV